MASTTMNSLLDDNVSSFFGSDLLSQPPTSLFADQPTVAPLDTDWMTGDVNGDLLAMYEMPPSLHDSSSSSSEEATVAPSAFEAPPINAFDVTEPLDMTAPVAVGAVVDAVPPPPPPSTAALPSSSSSSSSSSDVDGEADESPVAPRRGTRAAATKGRYSARKAASRSADDESGRKNAKRATRAAHGTAAATAAANAAAAAAAKQLKRKAAAMTPQRTQLTKAEQELGATLDLSRDELLNMTSDALEQYAQRLAAQRPLTAEEQKRFKRQRRLIKNRESAQLSRLRKKAYVDELEAQIADLKASNDAERRRADENEREATSLRAECAYLRSLLAQHPTLASLAADRSQFDVPIEQPKKKLAVC